LADEGLVSETEMMRSLAFGGERVASYSKKFCLILKNFTESGKDSCQVRPSVEVQKLGMVFRAVGQRNSCLKNPSIEAATQTSEGAVNLGAAEAGDEVASDARGIGTEAGPGALAGTLDALDARAAAELLGVAAVALTNASRGMRKDLKLVPDALTVR
jgi:hypothetical protein